GSVDDPKSGRPGPIVHAIGSLGTGGSERQMRITVANMQKKVDAVKLLCISPEHDATDFFAREMSSRSEVTWNVGGLHDRFFACREVFQRVRQLEQVCLPIEAADTLLGFVSQFERLRPRVVHGWLDYTNVTAGLAAVICGVPKIVLGCRSMAPHHFGLYRS